MYMVSVPLEGWEHSFLSLPLPRSRSGYSLVAFRYISALRYNIRRRVEYRRFSRTLGIARGVARSRRDLLCAFGQVATSLAWYSVRLEAQRQSLKHALLWVLLQLNRFSHPQRLRISAVQALFAWRIAPIYSSDEEARKTVKDYAASLPGRAERPRG